MFVGSETGGDRADSVEGKMGGLLEEEEGEAADPSGLATLLPLDALEVLRVSLGLHLSRSGSEISCNGICKSGSVSDFLLCTLNSYFFPPLSLAYLISDLDIIYSQVL